MATLTLTPPDRLGLSLANMSAQPREMDWSALFEADAFEVVYPAVTFGDVEEHAEDLLTAGQTRHIKTLRDKPVGDSLGWTFEQSDGGAEWRDAFHPMMNHAWPVDLAYEVTEQEAADLIARFAPTCSLVRLDGDSYMIALAGGGMDLSDQIATAYLCCGVCPPSELLGRAVRVIQPHAAERVADAYRAAFERAKAWHLQRAADADDNAARFANVLAKAAA